jgi:putative ABC transport system substrate-binding protein
MMLADSDAGSLVGKINDLRPLMVLAVGLEALTVASEIKTIPVMSLMVLNPPASAFSQKNTTTVLMSIPPEKQFAVLREALPGAKTIGVVYNPERSGKTVARAKEAAMKSGLTLVTREVDDPRQVPVLIDTLRGTVDVYWMLPDLTVVTPETVEYLLLFSLEDGVPILTFSEKYVEMGALLSVGIDAYDLGAQAGELAAQIISRAGEKTGAGAVWPRKSAVVINMSVAEKLRIKLGEHVLLKAKIIP